MPPFKDLTGQTFGRLTVVRRVGTSNSKKPTWLCKCTCGNETIVVSPSLLRGVTKSCGCLHKEQMERGNIKHGLRYTRIYKIWLGLQQRTGNVKNPNFADYGGRGIDVCAEWKEDFMAFYNWAMDNGYQENLSLDRKDNDKGYTPDNCRWATQKEQCNNQRTNRYITYLNETKTMKQWSEETGIPYSLLAARIDKLGWCIERALTEPVQKQNRRNKS